MSATHLKTSACGLALMIAMNGIVHAAEATVAPVKVTVTAKGCEPNELTVPAGTTTFQIVNKSSRVLEWEILKGVMVIDERENIAPGFTQKLTTKLEAGDYAVTCGLVSNPQGKLTVTAGANAVEAAVKPTATDLIGPSAEYRVYLHDQTTALSAAAAAIADAVTAGDLPKAADQYAAARAAYLRLKPSATLFADIDAKLDGGRSSDFQQLVNGLTVTKSTDVLGPVAAAFTTDVAKVQAVLKTANATPDIMIKGASQTITAAAHDATAATTPEQLIDVRSRLQGARRVVDLFAPVALKADKAGTQQLQAQFADVEQKLQAASSADADRKALGDAIASLAGNVTKLSVTLGLGQS